MKNLGLSPVINIRSMFITWVILAVVCGILIFFTPLFGLNRLIFAGEGLRIDPMLSDGQFVWGPNVGDFSVKNFLESRQSTFAAYAQEVEAIAAYTSVNPKVLLTTLEVQFGFVDSFQDDLDPDWVHQQIEATAYNLAIPFYNHLYTWGSRSHMREPSQEINSILAFEGEVNEQVDPKTSSSTFAIASALSKNQTYETWQSTVSASSSTGFLQVFAELFPETDPLDTSNDINPPSLPEDDFFQLPFPLGAEWTFNGPHSWCGGDACWQQPPDRSSIDFATDWHHGEPYPNHYTTAAAAGVGNVRTPSQSPLPCWYEIDHGDGWKTSYYHLQKLGTPGGRGSVLRNQSLGIIAEEVCNGGFANGAHVHFTLWYNGSYYDLDGIKLSGWTVHSGPDPYYSGYLERDEQILYPYDRIVNDYHEYYGDGLDYALRYFGNTGTNVDLLKLKIDDPETNVPGPPADVGFHDFVVEWWMKAEPGVNSASNIECGANDHWKNGNVLFDRSLSIEGSEWGVSLVAGRIAFGTTGDANEKITLCSNTTVDDGEWHHILIQRNRWEGTYPDGQMWLFIDGILEASAVGPEGDLSYPDDGIPGEVCGPNGDESCIEVDPYLVIGSSKWEDGLGFTGDLDDIRFSWWLRYFQDFDPPEKYHPVDSDTVSLLRFNEGAGDVIYDTAGYFGGTSNALRLYGGEPAGPEWIYTSLYKQLMNFLPYIGN